MADGDPVLTGRLADLQEHFLNPLLHGLAAGRDHLHTEAQLDAVAGDRYDEVEDGIRIARTERGLEVAAKLDALSGRIRAELDQIVQYGMAPLDRPGVARQYAFWMAQVRGGRGKQRTMKLSPTIEVTLDGEYVQNNESFLADLLVHYVQAWERHLYEAVIAQGGEAAGRDEMKWRITMGPSWRLLAECPAIPLSDPDIVTMVAVGVLVGLWELWPNPDHGRQYSDQLDPSDQPALVPTQRLLGVQAS